MSVLPGGTTNYESMQSQTQQPYDSRGYFQVSGLQSSSSQYGRQDQMSLQLV